MLNVPRGPFYGIFEINKSREDAVIINNTIVSDGAQRYLQNLFQAGATLPGTFYIGLTNASYTFDTASLAAVAAGEPVGNGYARQAAVRNTSDWDVSEIGGFWRAKSKQLVYTASADWTNPWSRAFLCNAASGTSGNVFALSGPTVAPRVVLNGAPPSISYEFWVRG